MPSTADYMTCYSSFIEAMHLSRTFFKIYKLSAESCPFFLCHVYLAPTLEVTSTALNQNPWQRKTSLWAITRHCLCSENFSNFEITPTCVRHIPRSHWNSCQPWENFSWAALEFAKLLAAGWKKIWLSLHFSCQIIQPVWPCVCFSPLLDADLFNCTLCLSSRKLAATFNDNFCKPQNISFEWYLNFATSTKTLIIVQWNGTWYLVVLPLLSPKCWIWNALSWNSYTLCRSYRTKLG